MPEAQPLGDSRYYRHSGKVPPIAIVGGIAASLATALIVGSILAIAELVLHRFPMPKLRLILLVVGMLATGFALGRLPVFVLMSLKARSNSAATILGLASGLLGLYVAWIVWLQQHASIQGHDLPLGQIISPVALWTHIATLRNAWHVFGDDSGDLIPLSIFWTIEFLLIVIIATFTAHTAMAAKVFCEHCGTWGVTRELMQMRTPDLTTMKSELAVGNFGMLLGAQPKAPLDTTWCMVSLRGCSSCDNLQMLTVSHTSTSVDKDGKTKTNTDSIVENILLLPDQSAALVLTAAGLNAKPSSPSNSPPNP